MPKKVLTKRPRPSRPSSTKKKTSSPKSSVRTPTKSTKSYSPEYAEYLERYEMFGEGRPRLSQAEFDRCDDELLDLLEETERGLDDDQVIRLQELEFLLLDTEQ
jgi:hypothetical protein